MKTESIICEGCGVARTWRGFECLTSCSCLKEKQDRLTLAQCIEQLRKLRGQNLTDKEWIDAAWEIYKRSPYKEDR